MISIDFFFLLVKATIETNENANQLMLTGSYSYKCIFKKKTSRKRNKTSIIQN